MTNFKRISSLLSLLLVGACTTLPIGPSVMVMPGTGKSFDYFRADDAVCRQYALEQIGGSTPNQFAVDSGVRSAAIGTVVGAAAGAALGGHDGAGTGAGMGLLAGSLIGTGTGESSAYGSQRRYDNAYIQCMYAKGNRVPVSGRFMPEPAQQASPPPPPAGYAPPPPPPGYAPPAPPVNAPPGR